MITPQDIRNILYRDCKAFGIDEVYVVFEGDEGNSDEIPAIDSKKGLQAERIVVYVKRQQPGTYWIKNFNEVNIQVPRIQNRANCIRMQELEHKALELLDGITGEYEGCSYLYQIDQIGTEADTALKCHYVNVILLFQVLNVK
jgi:hypothetical protein